MSGDFERAIELDADDPAYLTIFSLLALGRSEDGARLCQVVHERNPLNANLMLVIDGLAAWLERNDDQGRAALQELKSLTTFSDPEGLYYWAQMAVGLGDTETAIELLSRAVDSGFHCVRGFEVSPLLAVLRPLPAFEEIVERARRGQSAAERAFAAADGPRLLGLSVDAHCISHLSSTVHSARQNCVRQHKPAVRV